MSLEKIEEEVIGDQGEEGIKNSYLVSGRKQTIFKI